MAEGGGGRGVQNLAESWFGFQKPYDFFQFVIPGLVLLVAGSLCFSGISGDSLLDIVDDALPDTPLLQGISILIIAFVLGLIASALGGPVGSLFYRRNTVPDFADALAAVDVPRAPVNFQGVCTYRNAWVILREAEDRQSYNYCYYLWGLEGMLRGLAVGFVALAIVLLCLYDFLPGRWDNRILFVILMAVARVLLWQAAQYYGNMISELARSAALSVVLDAKGVRGRIRPGARAAAGEVARTREDAARTADQRIPSSRPCAWLRAWAGCVRTRLRNWLEADRQCIGNIALLLTLVLGLIATSIPPPGTRFIAASDAHFDDDAPGSKCPGNREALLSFLRVLDGRYRNSASFAVLNGDLLEYKGVEGLPGNPWRVRLQAARDTIANNLSQHWQRRLLFTVGNNDICPCKPGGAEHLRSSLDAFRDAFLPALPWRVPPGEPQYGWRDPLTDVRDGGVATYALFVPDHWLFGNRFCDTQDSLRTLLDAQLTDFADWVEEARRDPAVKLAVVFMHQGPVTARTDGLPPGYQDFMDSITDSLIAAVNDDSLYYDVFSGRIARLLERLDKNSSRDSGCHALVVGGHFHLGRAVSQLAGVDVIVDGAIGDTRATAERRMHTFVDVMYRPGRRWLALKPTYDGKLEVRFKRFDRDRGRVKVSEISKETIWLRG